MPFFLKSPFLQQKTTFCIGNTKYFLYLCSQFEYGEYSLLHIMIYKNELFLLTDKIGELANLYTNVDKALAILYCKQGKLQITWNNQQLTMIPNDLLVCMPNSLINHYLRSEDFQGGVLCISEHLFDELMLDCFRVEEHWWEKYSYIQSTPIHHLEERHTQLMDTYLNLLVQLLKDEHTAYHKQVMRTIAQAAAYECLSYLEDHISVAQLDNPKSKADVIRRFVLLVREQFYLHRDVQWFAQQLAITPKYLSSLCKQETGYTASELIRKVTNDEIIRLLKNPSLTTKEIAFRLNFSDLSQFCRYVRKQWGKTTTQLRQETL